ncbi:MAG: toll/interleukin-1 receptor domain-containing protein [Planctomycetota bacterium]
MSYSHRDRDWFQRLRPLLEFDQLPTRTVHAWHDNELHAGDRWDDEIRTELEAMDVFVCLLSYNFKSSTYIKTVEQPAAFKREKLKKTIIIPLLLIKMDDRDIQDYKPFNPLPAWGKSWLCYKEEGGELDMALKPIRTGLLDAVERVLRPSRRKSVT